MKLLLILAFFLNSASAVAGCFEVMQSLFQRVGLSKKVDELALMKEIETIERQTNFIRKLKDNPEPAIILNISSKLSKMDSFLLNEQFSIPHREWRPLFREMEFSYVIVKNNEKALKSLGEMPDSASWEDVSRTLKKDGFNTDQLSLFEEIFKSRKNLNGFRSALTIESQQRQVKMGNYYQEYTMIREHLEELLKGDACNEKCKKEITTMLDRLGLGGEGDKIRFSRVVGNSKRPTLEELWTMMQTHPLISVARLKKERSFEVFSAFRDLILQPAILTKLSKMVYNLPGVNRSKLIRLFKVVYDYQARSLYFPDINQIVRSTKPIAEKFNYMRELNSAVDSDELITTFARRIDHQAKTTWKDLRVYSEANDKEFFQRMIDAEAKAKARGEISLTVEQSVPAKIAAIIFAGGAVGYYYFDKDTVLSVFDSSNIPTNEDTTVMPPNENSQENQAPKDEEKLDVFGEEEELIKDAAEFLMQNGDSLQKEKSSWSLKKANKIRLPAQKTN